jgi:hypothetical protein
MRCNGFLSLMTCQAHTYITHFGMGPLAYNLMTPEELDHMILAFEMFFIISYVGVSVL